jgi:hypothetical protein
MNVPGICDAEPGTTAARQHRPSNMWPDRSVSISAAPEQRREEFFRFGIILFVGGFRRLP